LKDILETSVPITHQDVVLIFVTVSGMREKRLTQEEEIRSRDTEAFARSARERATPPPSPR
jgi:hypothetical protein